MSNTVCVTNLYPDVDVTKLCEVFGKFGRILSAKIEYEEKHFMSLCKGCIIFDNPSSAHDAAKRSSKASYLGRSVSVKVTSDVGGNTDICSNKEAFTKIFVKNIDPNWDDCDLMRVFEKFGDVDDTKISETDGKSNGYGFVTFLKPSSAKAAVDSLNNKLLNEKKLIVQPFLSKAVRGRVTLDTAKDALDKSAQRNNLHVKNLARDISDTELESLFSAFGSILSAKVSVDEKKQSKGFGFVCFHKEEDAKKALERMDQYSYKSRVLEVNYCQKKAERQQFFKMIHSGSGIRKFDKGNEIGKPKSSSIFTFSAKN